MQALRLPYGDGYQTASIDDSLKIQMIDPPIRPVTKSLEELLEYAMEHPYGTPLLENLAKPDDTVVIVMNDHTRPGPNPLILSAIMKRFRHR